MKNLIYKVDKLADGEKVTGYFLIDFIISIIFFTIALAILAFIFLGVIIGIPMLLFLITSPDFYKEMDWFMWVSAVSATMLLLMMVYEAYIGYRG